MAAVVLAVLSTGSAVQGGVADTPTVLAEGRPPLRSLAVEGTGRPILGSRLHVPPAVPPLGSEAWSPPAEAYLLATGVTAVLGASGSDRIDLVPGMAFDAEASSATLVAHVLRPVEARQGPAADAPVVGSFGAVTERGGPTVFRVVSSRAVDGWIEVQLPVRPNGTTGWLPLDAVELTRNPYRINLDVATFELTIHRLDEEVLRTTVALGNGSTPTPLGEFYLIELLRAPDPNGVYGPYAYGLSGFSDTLTSFNGGEGVIGIHGTDQPELLGTSVSHGCIRVDNAVITEMTAFLPLGTPVSIG